MNKGPCQSPSTHDRNGLPTCQCNRQSNLRIVSSGTTNNLKLLGNVVQSLQSLPCRAQRRGMIWALLVDSSVKSTARSTGYGGRRPIHQSLCGMTQSVALSGRFCRTLLAYMHMHMHHRLPGPSRQLNAN